MQSVHLDYYPPQAPSLGAAVLICPGGGYRFLSDREAAPIAHAFARMGCHAYVVQYDTNRPGLGFTPVRQLAAALRQATAEAPVRGFDADKIYLCGFSAGGHLAATLGVYWYDPAVTRLTKPLRPAGLILGYPVITMGRYAHPGSRQMLTDGSEGLMNIFSLEKHVGSITPPVFVWQTATDEKVPVHNSLMFVQALLAAGVSCEYHMYPYGPHGMSLATDEVADPVEGVPADEHIAGWLQQCEQWLRIQIAEKER